MKRKREVFGKSFVKVKLVLVNIRFKLDISMPVMVTNPSIGSQRHYFVMVVSDRGHAWFFFLISWGQWYLMITLEGIQEAHSRVAYSCVYQLVYPRHWERVFQARLVQVYEIYADSPFTSLLFYHHYICQPLEVKDFFDSPCLLQFCHFVLNSVGMLF